MRKIVTIGLMIFIFCFGFATVGHAQHYVSSGESMSVIAKKYNMGLKDLISLNPHIANPNIIHVGDYIVIRSKAEPKKDLVDYARELTRCNRL